MGHGSILKFNKIFNVTGKKKDNNVILLIYAFIKLYEFSCKTNMRILVIFGSPRDLVCTLLLKKKKKKKKKKK